MPRKRRVAEPPAEQPALPIADASAAVQQAPLVDIARKLVTIFRIGFQLPLSILAGKREMNDALQTLVQKGELTLVSRAFKGLSMYLPKGMKPQGGQALRRDVSILMLACMQYERKEPRKILRLTDSHVRALFPGFKEGAKNIRPHVLEHSTDRNKSSHLRVLQTFVTTGDGSDIEKTLHKELDELLLNPYVADAIRRRIYGFAVINSHWPVVNRMHKMLLKPDKPDRDNPRKAYVSEQVFVRVYQAPGDTELAEWIKGRHQEKGADNVVAIQEDAAD